jgi:DNA uptake protein ComE-like DNA-binding protein
VFDVLISCCARFVTVAVRTQTRHAGSRILNINTAQEEEFVRLNLLYTGFFGEAYT